MLGISPSYPLLPFLIPELCFIDEKTGLERQVTCLQAGEQYSWIQVNLGTIQPMYF